MEKIFLGACKKQKHTHKKSRTFFPFVPKRGQFCALLSSALSLIFLVQATHALCTPAQGLDISDSSCLGLTPVFIPCNSTSTMAAFFSCSDQMNMQGFPPLHLLENAGLGSPCSRLLFPCWRNCSCGTFGLFNGCGLCLAYSMMSAITISTLSCHVSQGWKGAAWRGKLSWKIPASGVWLMRLSFCDRSHLIPVPWVASSTAFALHLPAVALLTGPFLFSPLHLWYSTGGNPCHPVQRLLMMSFSLR